MLLSGVLKFADFVWRVRAFLADAADSNKTAALPSRDNGSESSNWYFRSSYAYIVAHVVTYGAKESGPTLSLLLRHRTDIEFLLAGIPLASIN